MKRRHFLLTAASGLPCCLVPGELLRRAAQAFEAGDPTTAIGAPARAAHTLHAVYDDARLQFFLDSTEIGPGHFTWQQWIDAHGFSLEDSSELRDALVDHWLIEEDDPLNTAITSLEDPIPDTLMEHYIEGSWAASDSPQAQACHYLEGLGLGNARSGPGEALGELNFYEGACPGSNFAGVETYDELVLPALQRRLLELGEDTRLVVR